MMFNVFYIFGAIVQKIENYRKIWYIRRSSRAEQNCPQKQSEQFLSTRNTPLPKKNPDYLACQAV
jgi:hypothetical protein